MIEFHFKEDKNPLFEVESTNDWIRSCIQHFDKTLGEINFIFLNDEELLEINRQHLNHDYYTDIITFDYCIDDVVSGDIHISTERVEDNGMEYGDGFDQELGRVMAHGILHLVGFKDDSDETKAEMRKQEEFLLTLRK